MKELEQHFKKQERAEIVAKQQKESQYLLTGTIQPKRGHKVWQINKETKEVSEAKYKETAFEYALALKGDLSKKRELVTMEGFVYIPALNAENALKKFNANPNQSGYYKNKPLLTLD